MGSATDCQLSAQEENKALRHDGVACVEKHQVKAVVKQRKKSDYIRYSKEIPGERVQLDVMKVRNGAYQFTAIDDCTRLRTIRIYPNKKAESTIHFLGEILNTFPFPVQRIQTDWST